MAKVNPSFGVTVDRSYNKNFISSEAEREVEAPTKEYRSISARKNVIKSRRNK